MLPKSLPKDRSYKYICHHHTHEVQVNYTVNHLSIAYYHMFLQMKQGGRLTNQVSVRNRPNHGLARYAVVISVHVGSSGVKLQEKLTE